MEEVTFKFKYSKGLEFKFLDDFYNTVHDYAIVALEGMLGYDGSLYSRYYIDSIDPDSVCGSTRVSESALELLLEQSELLSKGEQV